jgi:hypothetical protein
MVKKETIGKIQLILGMVLLVGAIIGSIYSYNLVRGQIEASLSIFGDNLLKNSVFSSNETKLDITLSYVNLQSTIAYNYTNSLIILECSLAMVALLSIIMVLQGLANMGDKK